MTKYKALLDIVLYHDYFRNGLFEALTITPDKETADWLKTNGIMFRQKENSLNLFAPSDLNIGQAVNSNPDLKLSFKGAVHSPFFINYTDFPINHKGVIVFSSQPKTHPDQPTELVKTFKATAVNTLEWIRISIHLEHIEHNQQHWPNQYTAHFNARAIRWKYIIIDRSKHIDHNLSLSGNAQSLFSGPHKEKSENTGEVYVFDSDNNLIPLKEENDIDLSLIFNNSSVQLPAASPNPLQFDSERKVLYTSIYVYI